MTERLVRARSQKTKHTASPAAPPNATVDLDKDIPWSGVRLGEPNFRARLTKREKAVSEKWEKDALAVVSPRKDGPGGLVGWLVGWVDGWFEREGQVWVGFGKVR
jgi:hypothetical protein